MSDESPAPRRQRLVILGVVALVVVALAVVLIVRGRKGPSRVATLRKDAGSLVRAPKQPGLPDALGIHLGGVVVDGANIPVAGATLIAEPEAGAPDRALATA